MTIDIIPVFVAQSASHISFANNGTLVGAAVFGNPGTYDGIPFSLWDTPFTTPTLSLGSGVNVTIGITGGVSAGSVTGGGLRHRPAISVRSLPKFHSPSPTAPCPTRRLAATQTATA